MDKILQGLDPDTDCAAVYGDRCLVTKALPDVPHPLILQVAMQSGGCSTTFYVDLPPLDDGWPDLDEG